MHEIMHCLGFGHSFDLPPDQIMGDDITQGTSELTLPGLGDLDTGLSLFRPQSTDIDMYEFTVITPEHSAPRPLRNGSIDPSLLNTELRLFTRNADGAYTALAQNDDYFGTDSYINLQLQPGTYYVGVSASGNNQYDPLLPDSGMGGTTQGPYELRLNFTPLTTGPATALTDGSILLSGSNIVLKTGTTPFVQGQILGQVAITGIDTTNVPSVAALNGETFQITDGTSQPFTFQFVDTSVSQTPQQGNMAIYFDSATDNLDAVRGDMVATINSVVTHLVGPTGTLFDGDADGTPGGTYNYWFNVTGPEDKTLFVDKSSTSTVQNGTLADPYQTISAALAAAAVDSQAGHHDIVRIEGNAGGIALIDANGNDITGNNLADKETFTVSDGTHTVTFEFINASLTPVTTAAPGDVAVTFTPGEIATSLAASIAAAINNPVYHDAQGNQHTYVLNVVAAIASNDARQIALNPENGSLPSWNPGTTPLGFAPQDTLAYEIGTGIEGNPLSDGATMESPRRDGDDRRRGGRQTASGEHRSGQHGSRHRPQRRRPADPGHARRTGMSSPPTRTRRSARTTTRWPLRPIRPSPATGAAWSSKATWINAYNAANPANPRTDYEHEGIFLNYVNHADISYGGGSLWSARAHRLRPDLHDRDPDDGLLQHHQQSADAAMSADPNSFQDIAIRGQPGVGQANLYTADYDRMGPELRRQSDH